MGTVVPGESLVTIWVCGGFEQKEVVLTLVFVK
jgi:hypothetical protein